MKILDACCGSRMFWFDKENEHTTFMDIREEKLTFLDRGNVRHSSVKPDIVADFRNIPFDDNSFNLVVFDPPHLVTGGQNSWLVKKYGKLDRDNWKSDITRGFSECMRVLKPNGTLIFKWSDCQINVREILNAIPFRPLFGQQRGTTHWMVFAKIGTEE
ncbi:MULTISPECIES: class I SAM-dependent methyltransferase [unclassified Streptococcus]|uniref:class I SAM-dependent methyltransferase n=1 Tax=unclassified Streptococcus TaxID=2608887 RepID=UPI00211B22C2|nr:MULTISPECIES: class I SAM-dependent methyltransferase [unclassified Streptococcus]MCQ9211834.1 class I SAM-dependent methyltransferase [Streptococcus sp. B01]MCQ9212864.1 class I SAM-dependent methyltransferase [Streptococcus sp. B01]MCQ9212954.1 class I SAM-dependent methyltransferase [Streptococcus sp. O1]MCQ9215031.1 class I SAM-dependent methyltransferase [Streptococcus sp. O1]